MSKYRWISRSGGLLAVLAGGMILWAQPPQGGPGGMPWPGQQPGGPMGPGRGQMQGARPPAGRASGDLPPGRWWADPSVVQQLSLTSDQQKQIETVFQTNREKLIDLNASLQKAELALEPLMDADPPDQAKALPLIDRVAEARAELEKANARMLLGFRAVLSKDQWTRLRQADARPGPPQDGARRGGPPPRNGGR